MAKLLYSTSLHRLPRNLFAWWCHLKRLWHRYLESRPSAWTLDAATWTGAHQTSCGALRPIASPIAEEIPFAWTSLPGPRTAVKSLMLPPCRRSLLPKLVHFQVECLWPYRTEYTCIAYCVWECTAKGWGIDLFATSRDRLSEHLRALEVFGISCDRCIPQAVAVKAYFRAEFPAVPSAIIIHVQTDYCTFLLIAGEQIAAQVTLSGNVRDVACLTDAQRAKGRQILCGLQAHYRQLSPRHDSASNEAIALLITGNKETWNWQVFTQLPCAFFELGTEDSETAQERPNAEALGLFHLARSGACDNMHLSFPLASRPNFPWGIRAFRGLAALALALLAVVIQIQGVEYRRARTRAIHSLADLERHLPPKSIAISHGSDLRELRALMSCTRAQLFPSARSDLSDKSALFQGLKWLTRSWRDWPLCLRIEEMSYREAPMWPSEGGDGPSAFFLRVSTRTARALAQFLQHVQREKTSSRIQSLQIEHKAWNSVEVRFTLGLAFQAKNPRPRARSLPRFGAARAQ